MAFLLLFSTLSFTVDMHFCGKSLVDVSLYHEAEGCGMSMDDQLMVDMGCCSDVEWSVDGQDSLEKAPAVPDLAPQFVALLQVVSMYNLLEPELRSRIIPFKEYSPPKLVPDITVRDQQFLI